MRGGRLFGRLLATHLLVAFGGLAVLGITADRIVERRAIQDLEDQLVADARGVQATIARDGVNQDLVQSIGAAAGTRFTVVRADGIVLADSEHDPATMENHTDRPEVRAALAGRIGVNEHVSGTLGRPFLYVALPVRDGVVVRAALAAGRVAERRDDVRRAVALSFSIGAALAVAISLFASRTVARPLRQLSEAVEGLARGEVVTPRGPREARALATAMNQMAADLAARLDEIRRETGLREQILTAMEDGVLLADGTRIVYANPAARAFFGTPEGGPLPPSIPVPTGDEPQHREVQLHHPRARELRVVSARLTDGRLLAVARDVTDSNRIDRIRRDFVANASHELKTPVAGILATAETMREALADDPDAARGFAETLVGEAQRLSALVEDLLDLARVERPLAQRADLELSRLVHEVAADTRRRCAERNLRLDLTVEPGIAVVGRSEDLRLLVRNLLDNAIRYTPAHGTIRVALHRDDGWAVLRITDTGAGIPQRDLPRIFERFFRVDPARARDTGGTGLGLSIVRHVAESHGGSVAAESELGRGSTFTVTLPRARV